MPNSHSQKRAFLDVVSEREAEGAIKEIRATLAGMRATLAKLDKDIAYSEALLAATEHANAKSTKQ